MLTTSPCGILLHISVLMKSDADLTCIREGPRFDGLIQKMELHRRFEKIEFFSFGKVFEHGME